MPLGAVPARVQGRQLRAREHGPGEVDRSRNPFNAKLMWTDEVARIGHVPDTGPGPTLSLRHP